MAGHTESKGNYSRTEERPRDFDKHILIAIGRIIRLEEPLRDLYLSVNEYEKCHGPVSTSEESQANLKQLLKELRHTGEDGAELMMKDWTEEQKAAAGKQLTEDFYSFRSSIEKI